MPQSFSLQFEFWEEWRFRTRRKFLLQRIDQQIHDFQHHVAKQGLAVRWTDYTVHRGSTTIDTHRHRRLEPSPMLLTRRIRLAASEI